SWNQRMRRRRLITTVAYGSAGAAGAFLLGCKSGSSGSGSKTTASTSEGQPRSGGNFTTYPMPDPTRASQDPHPMYGQVGTYVAPTQAMLVTKDVAADNAAEWKLLPEVAAKWEQPDSTTILFTINPAAKYQNLPPVNGRAASAEDARYMIERFKSTKL